MSGLPIRGFDRLVDGEGEMRWKQLGLILVMIASGPDFTRWAAGRFVTESAWLPSTLCGDGVSWSGKGPTCAVAQWNVFGEPAQITIGSDETGRAQSIN